MKVIYAIGLIVILFLSACAASQQTAQPQQVTTPTEEPETQTEEPAEEEVEEEVVEEETAPAAGGDIVIQGKGIFDPEEFTTSVGSTVTFINNIAKPITLQFWDGKRAFKTDVLKSGETFEMTFDEEGAFQVKTLEFGDGTTITVE